jgi:hypothetical protein
MSTNELIDNIRSGDNVKANKSFDDTMKTKLNDALNAKKIDVASSTGKEPEEKEEE